MFEIIYQLRGEKFAGHVALNTDDENEAFAFCRNLCNFPAGTMHYAITHEDGRTLWDTERDGLLEIDDRSWAEIEADWNAYAYDEQFAE